MIILKNFRLGPVEQKAELLQRLEAEAALGWTTVSDVMDEKEQILCDLVTLIYETVRGAQNA